MGREGKREIKRGKKKEEERGGKKKRKEGRINQQPTNQPTGSLGNLGSPKHRKLFCERITQNCTTGRS